MFVFFRRVGGILQYLMIFCGSMTVFSLSQSFSARLDKLMHYPRKCGMCTHLTGDFWRVLYRNYTAIKVVSSLVNELVGHNLTCFLGTVSLYVATDLTNLFNGGGRTGPQYYSMMVRWGFYNLNYGLLLIISADVCRHVSRNILSELLSNKNI